MYHRHCGFLKRVPELLFKRWKVLFLEVRWYLSLPFEPQAESVSHTQGSRELLW